MISLLAWLLRLDISIAVWNLSTVPWYCDRDCYNKISKLEISSVGCLERGKSCLRWDEINSTFQATDFSSHFGPSIRYGPTKLSSGMHSLENYCRNPNDWHMGPWCFVMSEFRIRREACFKQCESYNHPEFCLAKMFFHICYHHHYCSMVRQLLKQIVNRLKVYNSSAESSRLSHLSDIIDVSSVIRIDSKIRPMFIPTYFNDYIRNYPRDISTRLRCYQTGLQTRIAGPWTYADIDEPFPKQRYWLSELFKEAGADRMDRERTFRGDGGPLFTRWRPCFWHVKITMSAIPCWPVSQVSPIRRRFPYYGPRNYNFRGENCISPFFAYEILLHQQKMKNMKTNDTIYLKIFRDEILYDKNKKPRIKNVFAHSKGRLMVSNRCFTLGDFLRGIDKRARIDMAQQYPLYHHVFTIGAGCFIEIEYRRKVEYQACFIDCPCNRSIHEPSIIDENRCGMEEKCGGSKITDEEEDNDNEQTNVLQNVTGIGDVKFQVM
ncbi:hypothetical protein DINM_000738 [Dirofilaria immitis]|nr:hypothetical protein [Dirofilaria immitis]